MCRWFAYISTNELALLDDVLIKPEHSIAKQVHSHYLPKLYHQHTAKSEKKAQRKFIKARNVYPNVDGTGIAFYTSTQADFGKVFGLRPQLYKTSQPPLSDPNFVSLCENNASTAIFAHIRMATSIVIPTNSHPFVFGRHSFMHNGGISTFTTCPTLRLKILIKMTPKARHNVFGTTDTEHLAGLYFSYLGDDWEAIYTLEEMKSALEKAIQTVIEFQKEEWQCSGSKSPTAIDPSSLNLCTTDGTKLLAFRFRNSSDAREQPPSLYFSAIAGPTLNRNYGKYDEELLSPVSPKTSERTEEVKHIESDTLKYSRGKHVIIASEPTTFNPHEWELIPKNMALMVREDMRVTMEPIHVGFTE